MCLVSLIVHEATVKVGKWEIDVETITVPEWVFRKLVQAARRSDCNLQQYLAMRAGIEDLKQIEEKKNEKA